MQNLKLLRIFLFWNLDLTNVRLSDKCGKIIMQYCEVFLLFILWNDIILIVKQH